MVMVYNNNRPPSQNISISEASIYNVLSNFLQYNLKKGQDSKAPTKQNVLVSNPLFQKGKNHDLGYSQKYFFCRGFYVPQIVQNCREVLLKATFNHNLYL